MNRTPIASPLLLVGRDATETWHGSDDEYREVGISSGKQRLKRCAFLGTYLVRLPRTGLERCRSAVDATREASGALVA